jgi:diadenosine tetraphosphatase ApaH/serine/threonine PP2A family protein phosphatase
MPSVDLAAWESRLRDFDCLTEPEMKKLCRMATAVLIEESNVPHLSSPVTICGDIHGQFPDLLELFAVSGELSADSENHYIFLGDLVDRGANSVETLTLLLLLKVRYPTKVTLIRGNHETRQVTTIYGFYDECKKKYGSTDVWRACTETFDCFPLAALVDGKTLAVHGGLSPELPLVEKFHLIPRRTEAPNEGAFCDLLWSDPGDDVTGWVVSPRGAGYLYGANVTREFQHLNRISLIARAHQVVQEGFKYHFDEERCVTVWSAPNYCYRCGNLATVLRIHPDQSREFIVFREVARQVSSPPVERPAYFL